MRNTLELLRDLNKGDEIILGVLKQMELEAEQEEAMKNEILRNETPKERIARIKTQMREHGGVDSNDMEWMADIVEEAIDNTNLEIN